MSSASMSPDTAWIVGEAVGALILTGPAYIAAKRGAKRAESTEHAEGEHSTTRDTMAEGIGEIIGRLDEQREQLADIRAWQSAHTTEHAVAELTRPALELRKGK